MGNQDNKNEVTNKRIKHVLVHFLIFELQLFIYRFFIYLRFSCPRLSLKSNKHSLLIKES